jgi:hypothetical protein
MRAHREDRGCKGGPPPCGAPRRARIPRTAVPRAATVALWAAPSNRNVVPGHTLAQSIGPRGESRETEMCFTSGLGVEVRTERGGA